MKALAEGNDSLASDNPGKLLLRLDRFNERMTLKGAATYVEQARRIGIHEGHYWAIRNGHKSPSLEIAWRMAEVADDQIEKLFERKVSDGPDAAENS